MARGKSTEATNLLYGRRPRAHRSGRLAPLETTRHLPWPGLKRLDPQRCLELLGHERDSADLVFPDGMRSQRTLWRGFAYRDRAGDIWLPCLSVGRVAEQGSGGRRRPLAFVVSVVQLDNKGAIIGDPEQVHVGHELCAAVEAASSVLEPAQPCESREFAPGTNISWSVGERLGQVRPRTYEDLAAAGML